MDAISLASKGSLREIGSGACEEIRQWQATFRLTVDRYGRRSKMGKLLHLFAPGSERCLVIRDGGMPTAWRWGGQIYDLAHLHAQWADEKGGLWYRLESTEGELFLLGRDREGWVALPCPNRSTVCTQSIPRIV
jgi:hypothetical protein